MGVPIKDSGNGSVESLNDLVEVLALVMELLAILDPMKEKRVDFRNGRSIRHETYGIGRAHWHVTH